MKKFWPKLSLVVLCLAISACTSATFGRYSYKPADHPLSFTSSQKVAENPEEAQSPPVTPPLQATETKSVPVLAQTSAVNTSQRSIVSSNDTEEALPAIATIEQSSTTPYMNPLTVPTSRAAAAANHPATRAQNKPFPEKTNGIPINPLTVSPKTDGIKVGIGFQRPEHQLFPKNTGSPDTLRGGSPPLLSSESATSLSMIGQNTNNPKEIHPDTKGSLSQTLTEWISSQSDSNKTDAIINDPELGDNIRVHSEGIYFSAIGLECYRVKARAGRVLNPENIAVCHGENGNWFKAPRVASR